MGNGANEKVEGMVIWYAFKCNFLLWLEHLSMKIKNNSSSNTMKLTSHFNFYHFDSFLIMEEAHMKFLNDAFYFNNFFSLTWHFENLCIA